MNVVFSLSVRCIQIWLTQVSVMEVEHLDVKTSHVIGAM